MQRAKTGLGPRRCRHNGALMDVENVLKGGDPANLPETYVIFLCEKDPFEMGDPVYFFEMQMREHYLPHSDGMHYLYMNSEYAGDDDFGKLAKDLRAKSASGMYFPALASAIEQAKGTQKGVTHMCDIYEQYGDERYKEGREEGIRVLISMLKELGLDEETAAQKLIQKFGLLQPAAIKKVAQYWELVT